MFPWCFTKMSLKCQHVSKRNFFPSLFTHLLTPKYVGITVILENSFAFHFSHSFPEDTEHLSIVIFLSFINSEWEYKTMTLLPAAFVLLVFFTKMRMLITFSND